MKKKSLLFATILTALFITNTSNAQYSIEANYGLAGVYAPSINGLSHFGAGISYDFNEVFGVKLDYASDKFRTENPLFNKETGINSSRISLQSTINISSAIFRLNNEKTFNLIAHAGGGVTLIKSTYNTGNDNVVNIIMGLTPRFKLADNLFFSLDTALIFNLSQHYNFDGSLSYENNVNSFTGINYNVTGGIVYKFDNY